MSKEGNKSISVIKEGYKSISVIIYMLWLYKNIWHLGFPGQQRAKVSEVSKFGRPAKLRSSSWWVRYFVQTSLEENEAAIKKFEPAITKSSYNPSCQIFHLKSYN
ncbi:Uncharacterized protein CK203_111211 [Vitis vinifera]|uniref:Uncharacterized protein n=1 Tax=Vitis vinifera TaxID=29760 RepID=A0A438F8K1_VITVI|nr:Uncharacterized protein CK203_111211 [Vitis vinifera]